MSCIMEHPYVLAVEEYGRASAICKTCCCELGRERESAVVHVRFGQLCQHVLCAVCHYLEEHSKQTNNISSDNMLSEVISTTI